MSRPVRPGPDDPYRVLLVDHTGDLGGAEIALTRLLPALDPGVRASVLLLADGPLRSTLTELGIPVEILELDRRLAGRSRTELLAGPLDTVRSVAELVSFVARLARAFRASGADLLVANSLKSAVLVAAAAPLARRPWVWHLHDRLASDYLPWPVAAGLRRLARLPRQVVVNSHETATHLGPLPVDRVTVAYPGLPGSAFAAGPREAPARPRLGILGRLSSTKGQREFLEAAGRVAETHRDVEFRVIGTALFNDHAYAEEIRAVADRVRLGDRVVFVGWTADPRPELDQLSGLVHASPVPEPFGQVVVEAMARRVPVTATRAGGVAEILDPSGRAAPGGPGRAVRTELGQLVEPGDVSGLVESMAWVLDHPDLAAAQAERAFRSAERRFAIEVTAAAAGAAWRRALS